ncbi:hypothetical protein B296_00041288 [Ensete ventricosum]|uniref:Uncharacterized protein n=1 Tax=Ensete ventricosum TaxID=4639 RepID=A0A426ZHH4_ENSVE|nr:hypothetical protein B296_00041288 [Ensete ventricosum]
MFGGHGLSLTSVRSSFNWTDDHPHHFHHQRSSSPWEGGREGGREAGCVIYACMRAHIGKYELLVPVTQRDSPYRSNSCTFPCLHWPPHCNMSTPASTERVPVPLRTMSRSTTGTSPAKSFCCCLVSSPQGGEVHTTSPARFTTHASLPRFRWPHPVVDGIRKERNPPCHKLNPRLVASPNSSFHSILIYSILFSIAVVEF